MSMNIRRLNLAIPSQSLEMSEKRVSLIELTLLPKAEEGEADD